jgi:hypothetical protein
LLRGYPGEAGTQRQLAPDERIVGIDPAQQGQRVGLEGELGQGGPVVLRPERPLEAPGMKRVVGPDPVRGRRLAERPAQVVLAGVKVGLRPAPADREPDGLRAIGDDERRLAEQLGEDVRPGRSRLIPGEADPPRREAARIVAADSDEGRARPLALVPALGVLGGAVPLQPERLGVEDQDRGPARRGKLMVDRGPEQVDIAGRQGALAAGLAEPLLVGHEPAGRQPDGAAGRPQRRPATDQAEHLTNLIAGVEEADRRARAVDRGRGHIALRASLASRMVRCVLPPVERERVGPRPVERQTAHPLAPVRSARPGAAAPQDAPASMAIGTRRRPTRDGSRRTTPESVGRDDGPAHGQYHPAHL